MYTKWTSHISDPEEKQRFQNEILASRRVLERLAQIINEDESNLDRVELSVKQFEVPNWEQRQIWYNASRAAYHALKKLIDLDQQDIPNDRKLTYYTDQRTNKH